MKKAWKFLIPIIFTIIVIGFILYLIIPSLTGTATTVIVLAVIIGLILILNKNLKS